MIFDYNKDDEQDDLFVQPSSIINLDNEESKDEATSPLSPSGFEKIDLDSPDQDIKNEEVISPDHSVENPFERNLANSESMPATQKLDVVIKDNYMGETQPNDDALLPGGI